MAKATSQPSKDARNAEDYLGQVYVAHQVHTLAQIVYQQLARGSIGMNQGAASPNGSPWAWAPVRPLNYWYP